MVLFVGYGCVEELCVFCTVERKDPAAKQKSMFMRLSVDADSLNKRLFNLWVSYQYCI